MKLKVKPNNLKFRCSSVGKLMVGGKSITENQLAELEKLTKRQQDAKNGKAKELTVKMLEKMNGLIQKRDTPFELSDTAKSLVKQMWLFNEFGFREPLYNKEILKGRICEQDALTLISELYGKFYRKNTIRYRNDFLSGEPDVVEDEYVRDTKVSWSLKQFMNVDGKSIIEDYYAQGQCYMWLTGTKKFYLDYCLVNTPKSQVFDLQKSLFYKFNKPEGMRFDEAFESLLVSDDEFRKAVEQIEKNHIYDEIPTEMRVKTFEFDLNENYIKEMVFRISEARRYYSKITL